ncbi:MAG TPA: nickel pincer cofactor biosynthesis protein LarC [Thermomicrobiales bacterium]|nr:nickel pincer cofactor biosynthesis protein LarC [Thermomicrobiales bacterium]
MKIAYFDPFSGASGDMILGALVDAGLPLSRLAAELGKLGVDGYDLSARQTGQHGIHGTRVVVRETEHAHGRTWSDIRALIERSELDAPIRDAAISIFQRLAEAEAKIHASTPEEIHFHEVGGIDAIVDICGACIGLALLGIEEVYAGPLQVGSGFARSAHGIIPVPAPATAELLANAHAPIARPLPEMNERPAELLTPTGAAILTTLAEFRRPSFVPSAVGFGFGTMELPWPNALRVWIGETASTSDAGDDGELVLETNIDDMNPQFIELVMERLFAAGALDVWLTPITMKKGRPATTISVLAAASKRHDLERILIENTTTLGIRATAIDRVKVPRAFETVATRWGDIPLKLKIWNGRVIDISPEYDACVAIARHHDLPVKDIWNEAYRLGESLIGQRR